MLFRLGEACDNACGMCSNSGRPELRSLGEGDLLRRVGFLAVRGVRAVVVTGGEPTAHPAFWAVVERLAARGLAWDVNTNGRRFADPGFVARARATGLRRAIVSLHSLRPETARAITGADGHAETLAGIAQLLDAGVPLMVNCVLSRPNLDEAPSYVAGVAERFPGAAIKLAFPSWAGRGGAWPPIQLRYADVADTLRPLPDLARRLGATLCFESLPACVLGDPTVVEMSRSGFGETHYLDDLAGDQLYSIRWIEAEASVFDDRCPACALFDRCPGVSRLYADRHGTEELMPFG